MMIFKRMKLLKALTPKNVLTNVVSSALVSFASLTGAGFEAGTTSLYILNDTLISSPILN